MFFVLVLNDGSRFECKRLPRDENSSTMEAEVYGVKVYDRGVGTFSIHPWHTVDCFSLVDRT